jgi:hypothetical protein
MCDYVERFRQTAPYTRTVPLVVQLGHGDGDADARLGAADVNLRAEAPAAVVRSVSRHEVLDKRIVLREHETTNTLKHVRT